MVKKTPAAISTGSKPAVVKRSFVLRTTVCFVTWSKSRIFDHVYFHQAMMKKMPSGTEIFGSRELHKSGKPHYHAVIRFPYRVHWTDARRNFMIDAEDGMIDSTSIRIDVPNYNERMEDFLERTQAYCAKDENKVLFGERFQAKTDTQVGNKKEVGPRVLPVCTECSKTVTIEVACVCGKCADSIGQRKVSDWCCVEEFVLTVMVEKGTLESK
jgi:hypothetical protein